MRNYEWAWQDSGLGWFPSGTDEEEPDGQRRKPSEEAASAGARPKTKPSHPQTPGGGAQPSLPSLPPNFNDGVFPDAVNTLYRMFNMPQGDSGMNPRPYDITPLISFERARLPVFSGEMWDYYCWKDEWEDLQHLGNPHGLDNVRRFHLLSSLDDKVKRDLVLSSCRSADDVFRLLDNKYGNKPKIVLLISKEVQDIPPIKGNQPRKT